MNRLTILAWLHDHAVLVLGAGVFVVALVSGLVLTAWWCRLSFRLGTLDRPDGHLKCHVRATPTVGGVPLSAAMLLGLGAFAAVAYYASSLHLPPVRDIHFGALLVAGLVILAVGISDDLRGVAPRTKLAFQMLAGVVMIGGGGVIQRCDFFGVFQLDLGVLAVPFTVFWIVGSCNAFNFIDGMDGLASGVGAVMALVLAVMALLAGVVGAMLVAAALAGGLLAVLAFNIKPAKIFLGDSGSQLVGLILAVLTVHVVRVNGAFALPAAGIILSLPVIDAFLSVLRRSSQAHSPAQGDHRHVHHCLHQAGLGVRQVSATLWGVTLLTGLMGMACHYGDGVSMGLAALMFVALEVYLGCRLGCLHVGDLYRHLVHAQRKPVDTDMSMSVAVGAESLQAWWDRLKPVFEQLRLDRAVLTLEGFDGGGQPARREVYQWTRSSPSPAQSPGRRWTRRFAVNADESRVAVLRLESARNHQRDEQRISRLLQEIGDGIKLISRPAAPLPVKLPRPELRVEELAEVG